MSLTKVTYSMIEGAPVNVRDFGAVGDGVADDRAAIQAALDSGAKSVYLPPGTYRIDEAIFIKASNVSLYGAGIGATTILMGANGPYSAIDVRTSNGGNFFNIVIRDLTINGDKAARTSPGGNGVILLCNTDHAIFDTKIINVEVKNCLNAGILLEGRNDPAWPGSVPDDDAFRVERTIINGCLIYDNDGVGLSQFKTNNSKITNCTFFNNGLENLTVDIRSDACIIDGNTFFAHLGGTGNLGIDSGDACIISNNFIDNNNNTSAAPGFRNGISLNSQIPGLQGNGDVVITGNVILNCSDNGIYAHDDTGMGGDKAGNGVIVANVFSSNGTDIRVEDGYGPLSIKSNKLQSINISEPDANGVRFGAGEVSFNGDLVSDQTIAITSGDTSWKKVSITALTGFFTSLSSGEIQLPVGGLYQINASVRINNITAISADFVSMAIRYTPDAGGPTVELGLINLDPESPTVVQNLLELNTSVLRNIAKGKIGLYVRAAAGVSGNIVVEADLATSLTGAVIG